jgi:hypothetical protein
VTDETSSKDADPGIASLRAQVDAQAEVIAALEARLSTLESPPRATEPHGDAPPAPSGDSTTSTQRIEPAGPTGTRRDLLTKAAAATVGAVAAGAAMAVGQATPAAAAAGIFDGNPAVLGTANPTTGVGVRGVAPSGVGVIGVSTNAWAVNAQTTDGHALVLETGSSGRHMRLFGAGLKPPARGTFNNAGTIILDANQDLWLCIVTGAPGTWRRLGGASSSGALTVLPTPKRVYDSRPGEPPGIGTKSPLVGGLPRTCDLKANSSGVEAGVTAVMINLVATATTGANGGFLTVYRNGISWPGTSNLNWSGPNQQIAVTTITAVDSNAVCNLYANVATHVVVDVIGYFQ